MTMETAFAPGMLVKAGKLTAVHATVRKRRRWRIDVSSVEISDPMGDPLAEDVRLLLT